MGKASLILPFSGGIDTESGPYSVADGDFPDILNMIRVGNYLQKRGGTKRYNAQCLHADSGIIGGFRAYSNDGATKKTVVVGNTRILSGNDTTGVFTSLATLTAYPSYVFFEHFINSSGASIVVVCCPDGNTFSNSVMKYTIAADTAAALSGSPVAAWFPVEFQRYLFLFNVKTGGTHFPNRGYYSARDNGESHDTTNDFIRVPYGSGAITGARKIGDILFVFAERAVYAITGTTFSATAGIGNQQISDALGMRGCIAPKSLVSTGDFLIFLSEDGVRTLDVGGNSEIISTQIESLVRRISKTTPFCTAAGHYDVESNFYHLSFTDSSFDFPSGNFFSLICDLKSLKWYPCQYPFSVNAYFDWPSFGDNRRSQVCGADGYLYEINTEEPSDAKREKKICDFETDETWAEGPNNTGSTAADTTNFKEGTQGRKITAPAAANPEEVQFAFTSAGMNLKRFSDNFASGDDDFIQIKIYVNNIANVTSVVLFFSSASGTIPLTATGISYTIPASALATGWNTENIKKSAFTALAGHDFGNIQIITIRFNPSGSAGDYVTVDDLRLVSIQRAGIPVSVSQKRIGMEDPTINKGFKAMNIVADFFPNTEFIHESYVEGKPTAAMTIDAVDNHVFVADKTAIRKVYKTDNAYLVSSHTTGLTSVVGMCADDDYLYLLDLVSASDVRLRKLAKDFSSITSLALGAQNGGLTSLHYPISVDDKYVFLGKAAVDSVTIVDKANMVSVKSVSITGSASGTLGQIFVDDIYVYLAYCKSGTVNVTVSKLLKSDFLNGVLTEKDSLTLEVPLDGSPSATGTDIAHSLTADAEHVYFSYKEPGPGVNLCYKILKTDFSRYSKITMPAPSDGGISVDETFVYLHNSDFEIYRLLKSTMDTFDSEADLNASGVITNTPTNVAMALNDPSQYKNVRKSVTFPVNGYGNWEQSVIRNDQPGQAMSLYSMSAIIDADEKMP